MLDLPLGYYVGEDPDILILYRADGTVVAYFSAWGADPREIERAAREDAETSADPDED